MPRQNFMLLCVQMVFPVVLENKENTELPAKTVSYMILSFILESSFNFLTHHNIQVSVFLVNQGHREKQVSQATMAFLVPPVFQDTSVNQVSTSTIILC